MLILYRAGHGSSEIQLGEATMAGKQWTDFLGVIRKLLREGGLDRAEELLMALPFRLHDAGNGFGDSFLVLFFRATITQYVAMQKDQSSDEDKSAYGAIAKTVGKVLDRHVRFVAVEMELENNPSVVAPTPQRSTRKTVQQALEEAESLFRTHGPTSAVDRIHTALHGFLEELCDQANLPHGADASLTSLFSSLKRQHPALQPQNAQDTHTEKIMRGLAQIIDAFNPIRNHGSLAHPNKSLIPEAEAHLVINAGRSIFNYLDEKCKG